MSIDVSIIIPVANEENGISDTLDSLISQDFDGESEIIISVNNSTDSTLDISTEYSKAYHSIKVINTNPCSGKNEAINRARIVAVGRHHIICDGDVMLEKNAISELINSLDVGDLIAIGGMPIPTNQNGQIAKLFSTPLYPSPTLHGRLYGYNTQKLAELFDRKSITGFPEDGTISDDIWLSLILGREKFTINRNAVVHYHPYPIRDRLRMATRNVGFYLALKRTYPEEVKRYDRSVTREQKREGIRAFIDSNGVWEYSKLRFAKAIQACIYCVAIGFAWVKDYRGWDVSCDSKKAFE